MNKWTNRTTLILVVFIAAVGVTFPIMYAQVRDPNAVPVKQGAPPRDPNAPRLMRQTMAGQILPIAQDWLSYYDTAPRDTLQVYYNLNVFLNVLRLQELQIKQLTERVAALEKKLEPIVFPPVVPVTK